MQQVILRLSKRLLTMLTSWEELDDIKKQIKEYKSKKQASVHRNIED